MARITPLQAIKAFCQECQGLNPGDHLDPIRECMAPKGPLFTLRPGSGKRKEISEEQREASRARMVAFHAKRKAEGV